MKIFLNREVRILFGAAVLLLLAATLAGLAGVRLAANDYKEALIEHDAALAGYLVEQGMEPAASAKAITASKTEEQRSLGRQALEQAGMSEETPLRYLPEVEAIRRRYSTAALIAGALFSAAALAGLFVFFSRQEQRLEGAGRAIEQFIQAGEREAGQEVRGLVNGSLEEGSLAQLFNAINGMAASLTAHIQKEQQNREFLKETISDISHQLKTPLAALQLYNEIIQDEKTDNPVIAEFTLKSQRELSRMETLIQDLMKLARLDAGAIHLEKRPLDLQAFLTDILEGFQARAKVEEKQVCVSCPGGLCLEADEHWLGEALSNLVKNAFDHTTAGGRIEVSCEQTPLMVTIAVQDNGAGIHPEDLPHIFKRFYRSRFSQDRQGVGIGLTLARSIVEKHGGTMVVESEVGKGARFQMVFPILTNL